jgi:hypothetical protein
MEEGRKKEKKTLNNLVSVSPQFILPNCHINLLKSPFAHTPPGRKSGRYLEHRYLFIFLGFSCSQKCSFPSKCYVKFKVCLQPLLLHQVSLLMQREGLFQSIQRVPIKDPHS